MISQEKKLHYLPVMQRFVVIYHGILHFQLYFTSIQARLFFILFHVIGSIWRHGDLHCLCIPPRIVQAVRVRVRARARVRFRVRVRILVRVRDRIRFGPETL